MRFFWLGRLGRPRTPPGGGGGGGCEHEHERREAEAEAEEEAEEEEGAAGGARLSMRSWREGR